MAAVLSLHESVVTVDSETVINDVKQWLANYKLPRTSVIVSEVRRAANGKADYAWARGVLSSM